MIFWAMLTSFILTVGGIPLFIRYFQKKKLGQAIREEGPSWHEVKAGTPTMGGTVFILAAILTWLVFSLGAGYWHGAAFVFVLALALFAGVGFLDDFISIFRHENEGLTPKQKFLSQIALSGLLVLVGRGLGLEMGIPYFSVYYTHPMILLPFAFVWITGFSNAVNLTDGLDGLASGLSIFAYGAYAILAYRAGMVSLMIACLTLVSALLGFLLFNRKPARIFMGDVGSLALGAGLAVASLVLNNPWSLLVIGIVFVVETASVILQVFAYQTFGKRIFKMSPIHHHFEMSGWSERQVVLRFWAVGLVGAFLYIFLAS